MTCIILCRVISLQCHLDLCRLTGWGKKPETVILDLAGVGAASGQQRCPQKLILGMTFPDRNPCSDLELSSSVQLASPKPLGLGLIGIDRV